LRLIFVYIIKEKKIERFNKSFNGQQFVYLYQPKERNDLNFVIVNSMAMENDGCQFCNKAQRQLKLVNRTLNRDKKLSDRVYSRPILFTHFPLYRQSDSLCPKDIDSESVVHEKDHFDIFKPKYDCLSKEATQQVCLFKLIIVLLKQTTKIIIP
jgi:ethanolamine phosphate phosphodiesterase